MIRDDAVSKGPKVQIHPILDEEDHDLVYEVTNGDGFATNATTLDQAFELVRELLRPPVDKTPYDKGERLEPLPWVPRDPQLAGQHPDGSFGKVDFDNEESATIATLYIEKDNDGSYALRGYANEELKVEIEIEEQPEIIAPYAALQAQVKEVINNLSTETERIESEVYWQQGQALILVGGETGYRKQQAIMVYANGLHPSSAIVKSWADGVRDTRIG
jgi:hypothetical protein